MHILSLLALCLAAVSAVPTAPRHHQRIVGGTVTTIENWPENAAVLFNWSGTAFPQFCGSFIITNRSVVTAAHCFYYSNDPARFRHRFGSTFANSGGVVHNTNQIIIHPNYNAETEDCDIAIMRFTGTITFNNAIQPASIPSSTYNLGDNEVVWATGWGATASNGPSSEQLREVQVWTVNQATCRIRYALIGDTVTDNMLCSGWINVGGRDQCQGDSGGPLYHNRVAVGVCSWGRGCAMAFFPGVNARVSRFTSWIQSNA